MFPFQIDQVLEGGLLVSLKNLILVTQMGDNVMSNFGWREYLLRMKIT